MDIIFIHMICHFQQLNVYWEILKCKKVKDHMHKASSEQLHTKLQHSILQFSYVCEDKNNNRTAN